MSEEGSALKAGVKPTTGKTGPTVGGIAAGVIGYIWAFMAACMATATLFGGPIKIVGVVGAVLSLSSAAIAIPPIVKRLRARLAVIRPTFVPPLLAVVFAAVSANVGGPAVAAPPLEGLDAPSQPAKQLAGSEVERSEPAARDQAQRAAVATGIKTMWSQVKEATRPCDQAAVRVSDLLGRSNAPNLPAAYAAAEQAERVCGRSGLDVMAVDVPRALPKDDRKAFDEALTRCGTAYAGKSVLFQEMRTVIDGDMRPSRVSRVQQAGAVAQGQVLMCVAQLVQLAQAQGVNLEETLS